MDAISQIKKSFPIVAVAEELGLTVTDKGNGRLFAVCPFHREKNPSLQLYKDEGKYHCYGCQAKGDVLDLYGRVQSMSSKEVVSYFMSRLNLNSHALTDKEKAVRHDQELFFKATNALSDWYGQALNNDAGAKARAYLETRGVDMDAMRLFRIGFVPEQPAATFDVLKKAKVPVSKALEWGLLAKSRKTEKLYNPFFGRIVFPVANAQGICAFGGRRLNGDGMEKYINSAANPFFVKSKAFFGLALAEKAIRETGTVHLVEGFFDVIAMHQHGFSNTVCCMGTAVSQDQILTLARLASEIIILMDGDDPGRKAGLDTATTAAIAGVATKLCRLPTGDDPDELLRKEGANGLEDVFVHRVDGLSAVLTELEPKPVEASALVRRILKQRIDPLDRIVQARSIASHIGITTERLLQAADFGQEPDAPGNSE